MTKKLDPVELPARDYFDPEELLILINKIQMFVNINRIEKEKYWRPSNKDMREKYEAQETYYSNLVEKLKALANLPQRS